MKTINVLGLVLVLMASSAGLAQNEEQGNFGFGLKAGSTGIGLELTAAVTRTLNFRVGLNGLNYSTDVEDTDVQYDAEFSKSSGSYILDWHPLSNGFRLSGGAYSHFDNALNILAVPTEGSFQFNNNVYDASEVGSVSGEVDFGSTIPYLGIGWGNSPQGGDNWGFNAELGLQFQDSPSVNVSANNCSLSGNLCSQLASDLQAETLQLESDLEDFNFWPVFNIGVSYKF